ncbi:ribosome silencing factor [Azospirillum sp. TSO22-1]|uniref:ribosome silencing factor n=1 Tax=Azospirillum sp. TSO22-1 TaxID=716789 RepID=UPI000D61F731|nr:ribosome silencing factor [Azospirillum sp. TSO22-1]PWC41402.1 ribosome-associated protein IOJAP [Azospirillum sp. TSO22-1]
MQPAAASPVRPAPVPQELKALIEKALDDDQADSVVVIDLAGKTSIADYMIVASGRNTRHIASMAEKLRERLRTAGIGNVEVEGQPQCDWVLIDAGDVIVHLFRPEVRSFYNIEKMWGLDLPRAEPQRLMA